MQFIRLGAAASLILAAACAAPDRAPQVRPRVVLGTFTGVVDPSQGLFQIEPMTAEAASIAGLVAIPVVQDGTPGTNPPDTLEVVTESSRIVAGGCGTVDAFEGAVRVRSFFAGAAFQNVHVEITGLTPTGREACNSAPAVPGTSSELGLFAYGGLSRSGVMGDSAVATWRFRLPSTVLFTFTARVVADYVEPEAQVSGPGSATLEPGGIAFDAAGNGLAVWRAMADKVFYACYDAAGGAWSEPQLLDSVAMGVSFASAAPRVAAATSGFGVAWANGGIRAALIQGCAPGPIETLDTQTNGTSIGIASNGTGYLVAWAEAQAGSRAAVWDGATWTQSTFTADTYITGIRVVAEGSGYRVFYAKPPNVTYARWSGGAWGGTVQLASGSSPSMASSGDVTCMAWLNGPLAYATIQTAGVVTSAPAWLIANAQAVDVTMVGDRCLVAAGTSTGASSRLWNGAAWQPALGVGISGSVTGIAVAPQGSSEVAAVALQGGDLWVNRTAGGAWGTAARAETSTEAARSPSITASSSTSAQVFFAQPDAAADRIWTAGFEGAAPAAAAVRSTISVDGIASGVRMAVVANGDALAIWTQQHRGLTSAFWSRRQGGAWSTAQLLAENARAHAVASNGTDFMVAYDVGSPRVLVARRLSGGAFGSPVTVSTYDGSSSVSVASDGSGYALAWVVYLSVSEGYNPMASIFDGSNWQAAKRLTVTGSKSSAVQVAGRPGEYLFAWIDQTATTVSAKSWRATKPAATWTWEAASRTIATPVGYPAVQLAAGPEGFAAVWYTNTPVGASASVMTGGAWSAPSVLRTDDASTFAVASNSTGYLAVTTRPNYGTQSHAWTGGIWQPGRSLGFAGSFSLSVASDGGGYGVLTYGASPFPLVFIAIPEPVSGPFGAPFRVNTATPNTGLVTGYPLAATPDGFLASWEQYDPADPTLYRVYATGGL